MRFCELACADPQKIAQASDPLEGLIEEEKWDAVMKATKDLPKDAQEAILARFEFHPDGYTVESLAADRAVSKQWVYKLAQQSIQHLRRQLS